MRDRLGKTRLGDVICLQRGHDLPDKDRHEGSVPVMGSFGVTGWHNQVRVKGPGVTIGRSGASIGVVNYIEGDYWPLNTCLFVTDFLGNDPKFCYYWLKTLDLAAYNSGSAVPSLNRNYIYEMPVRIPDNVTEQRAIAHILGTLDDKIELNRRMNETLEAMARAFFKSWFVDFDPVRAKKEGRDAGLPKPLADLFPDSFENSELGEIPKGWKVKLLSQLTSYLSRGIGPSYTEEGGICVLNQKCIRDHRINFSQSRRHDSTKRSVEGRELRTLDILINSTGVGTLGRVGQLWHMPERMIVDSHVTVVRGANDVDPWFLGVGLLLRESDIEELGEGSTGQTELSRIRLGTLPCLVPPAGLQVSFGKIASQLLLRIAKNDNESITLASLRDALLPKLISGEIRVSVPTSRQEAVS